MYIYIFLFFICTRKNRGCSKLSSGESKQVFRPEGGEETRELWDSKLILLFAATGYAVVLGSVWCFGTWSRRLFVSILAKRGCTVLRPSPAAESKGVKMNVLTAKSYSALTKIFNYDAKKRIFNL
jgi:hypothetical protein